MLCVEHALDQYLEQRKGKKSLKNYYMNHQNDLFSNFKYANFMRNYICVRNYNK